MTTTSSSRIDHYWVGAEPYFKPYLVVLPKDGSEASKTVVEFFDIDGELINSATLFIEDSKVQCVALEPFLNGCKPQSGFKHCHAKVTSEDPDTQVFCRLHTHGSSNVTGKVQVLGDSVPGFFPIFLEEGTANLLVLMNTSDQEVQVKLRLYVTNRSPESLITLPPQGVSLVEVEREFVEVTKTFEGKSLQGYVRISSKQTASVGVQVLTREQNVNDHLSFCTLV